MQSSTLKLLRFSFILITVFSLSFMLAERAGWIEDSTIQSGLQTLEQQPLGRAWIALICFASFSLDIILPVPSSLVMVAATELLGPFLSFLSCFFGLSLSSTIAYEGCRRFGPSWVGLNDGSSPTQHPWAHFLQRYGFSTLLFTRPIPMVPELMSCLAGLLHMGRGRYYWAVALGNLITTLCFTYGLSVFKSEQPWLPLTLGLAAPAILYLLWQGLRASILSSDTLK